VSLGHSTVRPRQARLEGKIGKEGDGCGPAVESLAGPRQSRDGLDRPDD
jgi:hypothetical protein